MLTNRRILLLSAAIATLLLMAFPAGARDGAKASFTLQEIAAQAGVAFRHDNAASPEFFLIETMGAGCAWLDYDGDGWLDLFFVQSSATPAYSPKRTLRHALYRNLGNGKFADVTAEAGLDAPASAFGMGAAVGDFDNDGRPDLYLSGFPRGKLLRNLGGRFVDVSESAGVANAGEWGTSAAFFDYNKDGRLDLVVANYLDWDYDKNLHCGAPRPGYRTYCHPDQFGGAALTIYRNEGQGRFTDVTRESGMDGYLGKSLGVVTADFNNDGWSDVFVANDSVRNFLFLNEGNGKFKEVAREAGVAYGIEGRAEAGMGSDAADYDRDGLLDIYVDHLDMESHRLFRNNGEGNFSDHTHEANLGAKNFFSGFGMRFVDLDADGWPDILQVNGHVLQNIQLYKSGVSHAEPKSLWLNQGGRSFQDVAAQMGPRFLRKAVGRGLCVADWDNDGNVDFAASNNGGPAELWRNQRSNQNAWLSVALEGAKSNRDGVGARVTVVADGVSRMQERTGGGSYCSASDPRLYFGMGSARRVTLLRVEWPSGTVDEIQAPSLNRFLIVREGEGVAASSPPRLTEAAPAKPAASGKARARGPLPGRRP